MNFLARFGHYQKELEDLKAGRTPGLRRIQLDPIAGCNHSCGFCIYRYNRGDDDPDMNALFNESNILTIEKLRELFDDFVKVGIRAVEITGGGEPTLHPDFPEILDMLNQRKIEIGLVTHGAWKDNHFDGIVRQMKRATWARFSLDSATPETHLITHSSREGDFDKAIQSIRSLVAHNTVDVGISFIVQKGNLHEIVGAANLASALGVKYIRFGGVVFEGDKIEHIELTEEEHNYASAEIEKVVKSQMIPVVNAFDNRSLMNFERYNPGDTCYYSHLATVIGADAKLYVCCVWKYRPDGVIADLSDQSFADVWNGGALKKYYEKFDISEKCNRCFLKDKNDMLHAFVEAEHINFV